MRNRPISKHFRFSHKEAEDLKIKAKRTSLTEAALLRMLLKGYEPREKPDERFYEAMREVSKMGDMVQSLYQKASELNVPDAGRLSAEAERWHKFQADIEREFLRPGRSDLKWQ